MAKILIIDDDHDLVEATQVVLESAGYDVAFAHTRESGLAAILDGKPDLILLDVMMELEDDGFVVAQEVRKQGIKTPIIMLSNISRVLGMKFGADSEMVPVDEFTEKPLEPKKLIALVEKYLTKKGV